MGSDKSLLSYYNKPQCYHVYEMLQHVCSKVFISCNAKQFHQYSSAYNIMPDTPPYENIGPMAGLLTAFSYYPQVDLLIAGCDYPFITEQGLQQLLGAKNEDTAAAAMYNENGNVYEPLLAWYANRSSAMLQKLFDHGKYSLQSFLRENNAIKLLPAQQKMIISVDTPEAFELVKRQLINDKK